MTRIVSYISVYFSIKPPRLPYFILKSNNFVNIASDIAWDYSSKEFGSPPTTPYRARSSHEDSVCVLLEGLTSRPRVRRHRLRRRILRGTDRHWYRERFDSASGHAAISGLQQARCDQ